MMNQFSGFPEGKVRLTPIPAPFFSDLLPEIDDLDELKVTVYVFWRLDHMEGTFRYLRRADFDQDQRFMAGLDPALETAGKRLQAALERAVRRGTLLQAEIDLVNGRETLFFLNSPKGRTAVDAIAHGEWRPAGQAQLPVELAQQRPNIFRLYEEHIGPLTPMIAESLREAEETYPYAWIEDAIRAAVENNKRSWRYAEAILRRWQEKGRDDRKDRRDTEKDRRRYAEWED
jgi:DnaD/phage-associated family protein